MFRSTPLLSLALGTLSSTYAQKLPAVLTEEIIEGLGNNTLFTRWRPNYHFSAPAGWLNDPCAMMYDPTKDLYHLHYQWHPNHVNWGNISWGHATSKDMITWTDVGGWENDQAQSIGTGPNPDSRNSSYYGLGIFSGSGQPYNLQGEQDGTEKQAIAISNDGGETWEQYAGNPIMSEPPEGWNITGWRDPFVEPWPEMDALLGQEEPHWYMVLGSGIKGEGSGGGRIPFYSAPARNLTDWTFLGALWEPEKNETLGSLLETGTYGFNFEVSNFFSLTDEDDDVHYYTLMGTEGGNLTWHPRPQWGLWNEGQVNKRENGSVEFTPLSGGAIDSGMLYAVTSFMDTKTDRRIQWGWANEENNNFAITQQGYQGAMAIPREMYVIKTNNLINNDTRLTTKGNTRVVEHGNGTFTGYTLGARPLPEIVEALHNGSEPQMMETGENACVNGAASGNGTAHMHLQVTLSDFTGPAGVVFAQSPNKEEQTVVWYSPENNTINVDRSQSSTIEQFANYTMLGYFYPYTFADGTTESLHMDIFVDGSLVEVLVNDRFWLTTRIYPARTDSTGFGIWAEEGASVKAKDMKIWDIDLNVFPERPVNSSSELIWDTPEETNNYVWWTGN
ncbi:glycoside hydrolase family 32 protein [Stemphylium lycopersici]|uniref:Glycoside hydrolase family 32 protein n=1 Tax=Stemphylium lycopersici TaxID=183478 RepID=A0A364NA99_STELY|nr:glycoside hydrolase family 32 protein [Stemphylium lycopersici]RAR14274.1 glycoside hydrolase family 32 protein [Stemphylium lycopersici]